MSNIIKILHVDDELSFVEMSSEFLEREAERLDVITETSADDALNTLEKEDIDCVVSDYDMPGMNGVELLEAVHEEYPDLPFILFTGKGSEEIASEAISKGVTDYLRKRSGSEQYELLANRAVNAVGKRTAKKKVNWHQNIIQEMNEGVYVADADYKLRFVNNRVQRQRSRQDWIGRSISFLAEDGVLSSTEVKEIKEGADRILNGEIDEIRINLEPGVSGRSGFVELQLKPLHISNEDLILGTTRNITERRDGRHELKRYEALIQNSSDAVAHVDEDGTLMYLSPSNERIFGRAPDERVGKNILDYVHPDDMEYVMEAFGGLLNDPDVEIEKAEVRVETEDDEYIWVEASGADQTDTEVGGVVISLRDISERKEREEELEKYEAFIQNSSDVITHLNNDGTILYVSPSAERVLGYENEELVGNNVFEYVHPDDRDEILEKFGSLLNEDGDETEEVEMRFESADGSYVWLQAAGTDQTDTEFGGIVVNSRDVTERREYEDELERQNERLDEFSSVVSHDLRSPLTVAEGRLEMAQEECDSEHLDKVAAAHDRMETLIEDILTLASEGTQTETEPVELGKLFEDCWQNVETDDAMLVIDTEQKTQVNLSRLKQLCENLMRNAVEHGGDDVTVTLGEPDDRDGFYVADDGPGIPEYEREEVFKRGYSTSEENTGFGLRIVEQVAEEHGWKVDVTESEDGGARFEFSGVKPGEELKHINSS